MADDFGLSFSPTQASASDRQAPSPVQEAIRVLSLRQPRVVGARAPVPSALMGGAGSAGLSGMIGAASPVTQTGPQAPVSTAPILGLEALLRRLFGIPAPAEAGPAGPLGASVPPVGANGMRTVNESALSGGQPPTPNFRINQTGGLGPGLPAEFVGDSGEAPLVGGRDYGRVPGPSYGTIDKPIRGTNEPF